jgi:hypothetical protein
MHACPENGHFVLFVIRLRAISKTSLPQHLNFRYATVPTLYLNTKRTTFHQMEQYCQAKTGFGLRVQRFPFPG